MESTAFTTLLMCLQTLQFDQAQSARLPHVSTEEWREVAKLASKHDVVPLLHYRLKQHTLAIPDEVTLLLRDAYLNNTARNMRLYHELAKVLRGFQEAKLPVIVLKGAALAELIYGNVGLRPMGDVDLLVRKEDLKKADQELRMLGCARRERSHAILKGFHHFHYTTTKTRLSLEIHWDLINAALPFQMDLEKIWARAKSAEVAGVSCLVLSAEDLLLHLCLHTGRHIQILQLRMLIDIYEAIKYHAPIDWNQIGRHAQEWGIVRPVYLILRLSRELLGAEVPADWLGSIQPEDLREDYLRIARQQLSTLGEEPEIPPAKYVTLLSQEKKLSKKVRILCDRLFPTRKSMSYIYPAAENSWRLFLYYPVRWRYLFFRYGLFLWKMIWSNPKYIPAINDQNPILFDWFFPSSSESDRDL